MRDGVLLGIDLGTTELKAAAFDARSGRLLAAASHRLTVRTGPDGTREQDPLDVDRALRQAAFRLHRELGRAWKRVRGIGLAAQGGSAILADRETGRPRTRMQLWNDSRPLHLLPGIAALRPRSEWRRLSRLDQPGAGLARIKWLRVHHPRLFREGTLYVGAGEYAYFHLTGQWRQDAGNALQIGCYSVGGRRLVGWPLDLVGASLSFVAPLRAGHEPHPLVRSGSDLLGLPEGVPVAGPYIDHEAGYLSAAGNSARPLQCSLGTAWVGNFVTAGDPPGKDMMDLILPSPVERGSLVLRVMRAGNVTWNWAVATLLSGKASGAARRADAVFRSGLLPPDGLVALPWFTLPNPLDPKLAGNGGFLGLNAYTCREDMLRAVAAGMTFEFARLFGAIRERGIVDRVILGGGASKGWGFQTLLAGLFAPLPVFVSTDPETAGARGAIYSFRPRAAQSPLRRVPCPPAALRSRIERQYTHYLRARERVCREC